LELAEDGVLIQLGAGVGAVEIAPGQLTGRRAGGFRDRPPSTSPHKAARDRKQVLGC
jgi:hypothetical protein